MIPITRKDHYLNEIVGWGDTAPEKPYIEEEFFFAEILGEAVQAPEPLSRYQMYLAKIAGRNIDIPYPKTRLEYFLAKAAGMDITVPVPITREEIYWSNYTAIVEFEVENVPPLTYKAIEGTLKDYRIYGNTAGGESVGDRTKNLWNGVVEQGSVSTNGDYSDDSQRIRSRNIALTPGTYSISCNLCIRCIYAFNGQTKVECVKDLGGGAIQSAKFTVPDNADNVSVGLRAFDSNKQPIDVSPSDFEWGQIEQGSTVTTYEPYGYRVPVSVANGTDTETTNIYLDEQLTKSGDNADYIDYATQKRYNADGTTVDVELPTLQTVEGTNTLSVGTEVQPSKVYIKGEKER